MTERLEKCGANIASITERIDTTSSMGRFFFTLMAALGQLERDQVAERTLAAMGHLRRQQRRISGRVPFGFEVAGDGMSLIPVPHELDVLDRLRAARDAGASFRTIATELNVAQVPAKGGGRWQHTSVRAVLRTDDRRRVG